MHPHFQISLYIPWEVTESVFPPKCPLKENSQRFFLYSVNKYYSHSFEFFKNLFICFFLLFKYIYLFE